MLITPSLSLSTKLILSHIFSTKSFLSEPFSSILNLVVDWEDNAGYPSEKATLSAVRGLIQGGSDIIELGFPFSDPIADGPTIQMASTESLNGGTKIDNFFSIVKKIRNESDIPLVLMTYTNILYNQTYLKFISRAKQAGIDGLILPDMAIDV